EVRRFMFDDFYWKFEQATMCEWEKVPPQAIYFLCELVLFLRTRRDDDTERTKISDQSFQIASRYLPTVHQNIVTDGSISLTFDRRRRFVESPRSASVSQRVGFDTFQKAR